MSGRLSPGFADTVGDAQACFRLVLDAMAHPGRLQTVRPLQAPPPLCGAAAAAVLTLIDQETPLWLDPDAAAARAWIAFHTGAPVVEDPGRAMFAVALSFPVTSFPSSAASASTFAVMPGAAPTPVAGAAPAESCPLPHLAAFPIGTDEAPETSATLILQVSSLTAGRPFRLTGPGLRESAILTAGGLPVDLATIWQGNHALFPCGIDLILCAGNQLAALPRSVSVQEA
jgi:alpha-D-ribose 1-methylphosphonate 5-triphosphate synthase subunit PhnH